MVASANDVDGWTTEHFEYLMGRFEAIEPVGSATLAKPLRISDLAEMPSVLNIGIYLQGGRADAKRAIVALCAARPAYESVCTPPRAIPLNGGVGETNMFGLHIAANVVADGPATLTVTSLGDHITL